MDHLAFAVGIARKATTSQPHQVYWAFLPAGLAVLSIPVEWERFLGNVQPQVTVHVPYAHPFWQEKERFTACQMTVKVPFAEMAGGLPATQQANASLALQVPFAIVEAHCTSAEPIVVQEHLEEFPLP